MRPIVTDKAVPFVHFKAGDFDALPLYQLMLEMEHEASPPGNTRRLRAQNSLWRRGNLQGFLYVLGDGEEEGLLLFRQGCVD